MISKICNFWEGGEIWLFVLFFFLHVWSFDKFFLILWLEIKKVQPLPFLTVGLSKKSKSIRPNRLCFNSYIGPYCSLQLGHLELSCTGRNDIGISIFLFDHTMPNLTAAMLCVAPVEKYIAITSAPQAHYIYRKCLSTIICCG